MLNLQWWPHVARKSPNVNHFFDIPAILLVLLNQAAIHCIIKHGLHLGAETCWMQWGRSCRLPFIFYRKQQITCKEHDWIACGERRPGSKQAKLKNVHPDLEETEKRRWTIKPDNYPVIYLLQRIFSRNNTPNKMQLWRGTSQYYCELK